jgi:hypothetical protein
VRSGASGLCGAIGVLAACFWSGSAFAQGAAESATAHASEAPPPPSHRAGLGLLVGAGLHTGLSLGARGGIGDFGAEVTAGYEPLFAFWDGSAGASDRKLDLGSSAQFGGELYVTPWHPSKSAAVGLKGGYRYNTVLEHGFALAITFLATLSPHVALEGLAGTQIFPGAEPRLRRQLSIPATGDIAYGSHRQYFEYGFELIWYP